MQQEKQNNQWAESVGSLQELPEGFQFNPQKVWNDLEDQLPSPAKKSVFIYYAAASVLIIVLSAVFFLRQQQPGQTITAALPPVAVPLKSAVKTNNQQPASKQQTVRIAKTHINDVKKEKAVSVKQAEIMAALPVETKEPAPEINIQLSSSPLILEKKTVPKKSVAPATAKTTPRLKVIHLSELGVQSLPEPPGKQDLKQMVQQQQAEQQETIMPKENLKQILYFKTVPRTNTSVSITSNQ